MRPRNVLAASALLLLTALPAQAQDDPRAELCQYGLMIAQKAYLSGTFDAKYPDYKKLDYLVDYWGESSGLLYDKPVALRAVRYIAERMQASGIRRPNEDYLYMPLHEIGYTECAKYN